LVAGGRRRNRAKLSSSGTFLVFATYFGGDAVYAFEQGYDQGSSIALDPFNNMWQQRLLEFFRALVAITGATTMAL
jgi:hypothetical protein